MDIPAGAVLDRITKFIRGDLTHFFERSSKPTGIQEAAIIIPEGNNPVRIVSIDEAIEDIKGPGFQAWLETSIAQAKKSIRHSLWAVASTGLLAIGISLGAFSELDDNSNAALLSVLGCIPPLLGLISWRLSIRSQRQGLRVQDEHREEGDEAPSQLYHKEFNRFLTKWVEPELRAKIAA
ncbi:hypothetical protein ACFL5U_02660 [Candidatus Margulisiibacteriota bacterium]